MDTEVENYGEWSLERELRTLIALVRGEDPWVRMRAMDCLLWVLADIAEGPPVGSTPSGDGTASGQTKWAPR